MYSFNSQISAHCLRIFKPFYFLLFLVRFYCTGLLVTSQNRNSELYVTDSDISKMSAQILSTDADFASLRHIFPTYSVEPGFQTSEGSAHKIQIFFLIIKKFFICINAILHLGF